MAVRVLAQRPHVKSGQGRTQRATRRRRDDPGDVRPEGEGETPKTAGPGPSVVRLAQSQDSGTAHQIDVPAAGSMASLVKVKADLAFPSRRFRISRR